MNNSGDFVMKSETSKKCGEHWILEYVKQKLTYFTDSFGKDPEL